MNGLRIVCLVNCSMSTGVKTSEPNARDDPKELLSASPRGERKLEIEHEARDPPRAPYSMEGLTSAYAVGVRTSVTSLDCTTARAAVGGLHNFLVVGARS
jgi:hypothetical protein